MHPLSMAILTLVVGTFGFVLIGPLIGLFVALPFFDGDLFEQLKYIADPIGHPELKLPIYIMQGCTTLFGLGVIPAILSYGVFKKGITKFFSDSKVHVQMLLAVFIMTIIFVAPNSVIGNWNLHSHYPDFLGGFDSWARSLEDQQEKLTKFLTAFSSTGEFALAFVIIAILPAFGEEFLFRGMIQNQLYKASKNIHVAIWTSAILFSAFHLQFFGFVPRMLLGALFGYLYYWSGNLWMPMFAHFTNNGFAVIMLYLNQQGVVDVDIESDYVAPWPAVITFTLVFVALLVYYKKFFDQKKALADGR
jgi:membrane protease YdiL (CAAX protease family)